MADDQGSRHSSCCAAVCGRLYSSFSMSSSVWPVATHRHAYAAALRRLLERRLRESSRRLRELSGEQSALNRKLVDLAADATLVGDQALAARTREAAVDQSSASGSVSAQLCDIRPGIVA